MDDKFLEFFGNFLINMAQGKKHAREAGEWMKNWYPSGKEVSVPPSGPDFGQMQALFRKTYGLEETSARSHEHGALLEKAHNEFRTSMKSYLETIGFVSKQDHLELVKRYEALKEKCADQEETISHLKMLKGEEEEVAPSPGAVDMHSLVRQQNRLLKNMMGSFGTLFPKDAEGDDEGQY